MMINIFVDEKINWGKLALPGTRLGQHPNRNEGRMIIFLSDIVQNKIKNLTKLYFIHLSDRSGFLPQIAIAGARTLLNRFMFIN